ncbi:branched-chain amino acid ABC transporter permease [Futiania mangrovi]|uniref:Branched-chain amino acid ABC transporter permease n=1 Tax=Futiania mangrovi TaxID=2959716 RepID=A0A9J6PE53_9PROT|nr:branched-chain amino acid ABC transporter permease [Futiania mangrovii]MCP1337693.1 branched-chain amino acid ABC transporter permease [Futiania mangrovii]
MSLSDFVQVLITGIAMGGIYTLMGKGLFITFLTTRALNFGQGDFLMIASFMAMAMMLSGVPVIVTVAVTLLVMIVLGLVLERVAIRPLSVHLEGSGASLAWILTTLGFGMLLQNVVTLVWGKSRYYSPPLFSSGESQVVTIFGAGVYLEELVVAGLALLAVAALYWLLFRHRWGKEISAVAFDKDTAALLGINVRRVVMLSYAIMGVLTAVAGILVGPITTVQSHMGLLFIVKGFAAVCIGGFVNPVGILIAGIGFGVVEAFSNYFDSAFGDLYPFVLFLLFIVVRPAGIFAEHRADVR